MVAYLRSQSQRFPVALIAGLAVAIVTSLAVGVLPAAAFAQIADTLALGGLIADDGAARVALALAGAAALGAVVWAIVVLTVGTHILLHKAGAEAPILRPGDAHPDAPARRPISAAEELGPPFDLDRETLPERPLPRDLEQPLAGFDPAALPVAPRTRMRPVAPLVRPERIETFELTPIVRDAGAAPASLASLLDRLEYGAARHPRQAARSLADALATLRDKPA